MKLGPKLALEPVSTHIHQTWSNSSRMRAQVGPNWVKLGELRPSYMVELGQTSGNKLGRMRPDLSDGQPRSDFGQIRGCCSSSLITYGIVCADWLRCLERSSEIVTHFLRCLGWFVFSSFLPACIRTGPAERVHGGALNFSASWRCSSAASALALARLDLSPVGDNITTILPREDLALSLLSQSRVFTRHGTSPVASCPFGED